VVEALQEVPVVAESSDYNVAAMTSHSNPAKEIVDIGSTPSAPYSRAIKSNGLVYLSGSLAQDERGAIVGRNDIAAQTRLILERMGRTLAAAGTSIDLVVSVIVYLKSAADFQAMNTAYRAFWSDGLPTRTTVITDLVVPDALIEITMIAAAAGAERTVIHPVGWMPSPNPYSYAIRTGDTVFLAGLVPRRGRDQSAVTGDITVQTRALMDNAAEVLSAAGLSFDHVVSARVYLTDASLFAGMNSVYRECFPNGFPARATVIAGLAGPDFQVEMTFTASSSPRERVGTPPAGVPITPAVKAGRRVYLSGALGNTPETAGDVGAQTRETLARLATTLRAAGASPADVVEGVVFLKDVAAFAAMNEPYREFFGGAFPTRTTIGAPLVVADGLVEIMFTAVLP
jgi:enamine deaminase RidA (YjgF/YER057c/UK114 family)